MFTCARLHSSPLLHASIHARRQGPITPPPTHYSSTQTPPPPRPPPLLLMSVVAPLNDSEGLVVSCCLGKIKFRTQPRGRGTLAHSELLRYLFCFTLWKLVACGTAAEFSHFSRRISILQTSPCIDSCAPTTSIGSRTTAHVFKRRSTSEKHPTVFVGDRSVRTYFF